MLAEKPEIRNMLRAIRLKQILGKLPAPMPERSLDDMVEGRVPARSVAGK